MAHAESSARRYILYALLLIVLAGIYVVIFSGSGMPDIALGGNVDTVELQIKQTRAELIKEQKLDRQRRQELLNTRELASFVYPADTDPNRIVTEIEKLAYESGMSYSSLRRVGGSASPNDFLRIEEVTINGQVDIKKLAIFMRAVENSRPLLQWTMFNITPRPNQPSPNIVYMSGRLRALMLTEEAAAILAGEASAEDLL